MTVAQASLDNLIPQPRRWQEFTTTPIRVPESLKNWVLNMIEQKVAELRFSIGSMAPSEQTEQQWINEVLGLPEGYQDGDQLPENITAAVEEAAAAKVAAEVPAVPVEAAAADVPVDIRQQEPPQYTQAWIDWSESTFPGWTWAEYLAAIRLDVKEGHQSAKDDLAAFKANGVNIGRAVSDRQAAKLARRAARSASNAAAAVSIGGAALGSSKGSGQTRGQAQNQKHAAIMPEYDRVLATYWQVVAEEKEKLDKLFEALQVNGSSGKVRRYKAALSITNFDLQEHLQSFPNKNQYLNEGWMKDLREVTDAVCNKYAELFYSSDKQQEEENPDSRFYFIMIELIRAFEWAIMLIVMEDEDS